MTVAITSLNAYHGEIKETLGERQRQVKAVLATQKDATNSELADLLKFSINRITPRILELRDKGEVELSCIRECKITGRQCKAWKIIRKETLF
jgi:DNA-binding MarR family transcriptional regulator